MNALTRIAVIISVSLGLAMLAGCSKKPIAPYSTEAGTNAPEGRSLAEGKTGVQAGTITEETTPGEESLDAGSGPGEAMGGFSVSSDQNSEEYKKTYGRSSSEMLPIYFDFDQATIRDDQISRLEHNADYLKQNPSKNLIIEGNTDERGTNEYNLALGERRALNAKNYLIELGVEEYRIRTVSYGEERPLFTGQTEFDWSQNRRDDFILE